MGRPLMFHLGETQMHNTQGDGEIAEESLSGTWQLKQHVSPSAGESDEILPTVNLYKNELRPV